jgi:hypothetical protein
VLASSLAVLAFAAVYGAMLAAAMFARSAAVSAVVGLLVLILGVIAGYREDLAPMFEAGLGRSVFLGLTRLLPPLSALAELAGGLAGTDVVDAGGGKDGGCETGKGVTIGGALWLQSCGNEVCDRSVIEHFLINGELVAEEEGSRRLALCRRHSKRLRLTEDEMERGRRLETGALLRIKILNMNADRVRDTGDLERRSGVDVERLAGRPEGENSSRRSPLAHTATKKPERSG